ncbi:hypothetical protein L2E82_00952 [Cichorium intybus]|uniref:Uncharacterized protein n=1 Tax=Cichorium intybus TaxID=13427 RepID=A0ACB9GYB2_CICIN|nr:hypothetical protein L2E82_00952 [Cichorium intybus]
MVLSLMDVYDRLGKPHRSIVIDIYSVYPIPRMKPGTLKTVITPTLQTFHDVPVKALKFVDRKVDESVTKAMSTTVAHEIKNHGVVETASGLAKSAYTMMEPTAKELLNYNFQSMHHPDACKAAQSVGSFYIRQFTISGPLLEVPISN